MWDPSSCSKNARGRLANLAGQDAAREDGHGSAGPLLRVAGGQLAAGSYVFTVTVRRRGDAAGVPGTASVELKVHHLDGRGGC